MTGRICLTADEAFAAGFEEPCEHHVPDPNACPKCRLGEVQIRRLAVLVRTASGVEPTAHAPAA